MKTKGPPTTTQSSTLQLSSDKQCVWRRSYVCVAKNRLFVTPKTGLDLRRRTVRKEKKKITKEILRMKNVKGDTALHVAVRNNHLAVVEILTKEDPEFVCPPNNANETPLFLAAERGNSEIMSKIIKNCKLPYYRGPNGRTTIMSKIIEICKSPYYRGPAIMSKIIENFKSSYYKGPNGRTALHVAIMCGAKSECIEILLRWNRSLIKEGDVHGWRPLHYAAWSGRPSVIDQLLCQDKSVAYLAAEEDGNKTALHIAASRGNKDIMERLLSYCPDCWEMLNSKGQNVLHIAVEHEKNEIIEFILENPILGSLINQKDLDGNTPIHLHAAKPSNRHYAPLINRGVDEGALNFTDPFQVLPGDKDSTSKVAVVDGRNKFKSPSDLIDRENSLVMATLIAAVTFAAGFTLPGGYNDKDGPNHGMALFTARAAFKTFVISDTIALTFSIIAAVIQLYASNKDEAKHVRASLEATALILYALLAMMIAFMSGLYVVLAHSRALAIAVCVICSLVYAYAGKWLEEIVNLLVWESKEISKTVKKVVGFTIWSD